MTRGINLSPNSELGFGISIAGGKDVDGNGYPDILVGSYLANRAILLRLNLIQEIH